MEKASELLDLPTDIFSFGTITYKLFYAIYGQDRHYLVEEFWTSFPYLTELHQLSYIFCTVNKFLELIPHDLYLKTILTLIGFLS